MKPVQASFRHTVEAVAAAMMAAMFLTFILQIVVRYSARLPWLAESFPILDPSLYGWTLEFCLLMWIWLVFWGNAFIVKDRDHVTFDILFYHVRPAIRRWFVIIAGVVICVAMVISIEPTWAKFYILRLKKTATLSHVFGDWIRMRDIYSVYMLFLIAVALSYAYAVYHAFRYGVADAEDYDETAHDR